MIWPSSLTTAYRKPGGSSRSDRRFEAPVSWAALATAATSGKRVARYQRLKKTPRAGETRICGGRCAEEPSTRNTSPPAILDCHCPPL